jgi:guanylate kinase
VIKRKKGGLVFVISGPSGAGKSTVLSEVLHRRENIYFSISFTTRAPRAGEQDGVHYNFVEKTEFERMIRDGELLEYTSYQGEYYGTSQKLIQDNLAAGRDVVLDIEVEGGGNVRSSIEGAVLIFVIPPSFEELSRRLYGRRTEQEEVVLKRLARAREEIKQIPNYDYLVINDSVSDAAEDILAIFTAEHCRKEKHHFKFESWGVE